MIIVKNAPWLSWWDKHVRGIKARYKLNYGPDGSLIGFFAENCPPGWMPTEFKKANAQTELFEITPLLAEAINENIREQAVHESCTGSTQNVYWQYTKRVLPNAHKRLQEAGQYTKRVFGRGTTCRIARKSSTWRQAQYTNRASYREIVQRDLYLCEWESTEIKAVPLHSRSLNWTPLPMLDGENASQNIFQIYLRRHQPG